MRRCALILIVALIAGPADACLNDSGSSTAETQFRSRYSADGVTPSETVGPLLQAAIIGTVGVAAVGIGAAMVATRRDRRALATAAAARARLRRTDP